MFTREHYRRSAEETFQIIQDEIYEDEEGQTHLLMKSETYGPYKPNTKCIVDFEPYNEPYTQPPIIQVVDDDCLTIAQELNKPIVLNFGSGRRPGGGWLEGQNGQEESIFRRTTIFYGMNRNNVHKHEVFRNGKKNSLYDSFALISKEVEIIKDEEEKLCSPFRIDVVTCPAPNLNGKLFPHELAQVPIILKERIDMIMKLSVDQGKSLILGAWGCGVFKNDPKLVATLFKEAIEEYGNYFENIVFAIKDNKELEKVFHDILLD